MSQSHNETDECAVLSGQTSKKWGPSFTLCCSAREYMCTNTDSTDDNIEDHVQQFIHNATDNLKKDDWIQMGPFGLDIVQRVKQNSTSWMQLRQGRITSTKVNAIRATLTTWIGKNNKSFREFYFMPGELPHDGDDFEWNHEELNKCRQNEIALVQKLGDIVFDDTPRPETEHMKSGQRREQHCLDVLKRRSKKQFVRGSLIILSTCQYIASSPDAVVIEQDGGISAVAEFKEVHQSSFSKFNQSGNSIPQRWKDQCQHHMMASGAEICTLVSAERANYSVSGYVVC